MTLIFCIFVLKKFKLLRIIMVSCYYTIDFNGKEYPLRDLWYKDDFFVKGTMVTIGTVSLDHALFVEEGGIGYVSKEAERIDEHIIFFVEDDQIEKSDAYLRNVLWTNINN